MNDLLDVVIVTYNSGDVLPGLLDSLAEALVGMEGAQVIVADNASADDSASIARQHRIGATVIEVGYNSGYSAGINAAVANCGRHAPMLLLNADIRLSADCVRQLLSELKRTGAGVVAPKVLHEDGSLNHTLRREPSLLTAWSEALLGGNIAGRIGLGEMVRDDRAYANSHSIDLASGAILMISADARRAVGRWDERYFLYSEEVDYQRRVREAGFAIHFAEGAVCVHLGGESNVNPRLFTILTANRVRYFRQYHGPAATLGLRLAIATWAMIRAPFGPTYRAALRACWMKPGDLARLIPSPRAAAALLNQA